MRINRLGSSELINSNARVSKEKGKDADIELSTKDLVILSDQLNSSTEHKEDKEMHLNRPSRLFSSRVEGVSNIASLASFTTDVTVPLTGVMEKLGVKAAQVSLGVGSGSFRIAKGGIELYEGFKKKVPMYKIQGSLDVLIGASTISASAGLWPQASLITAVALLGVKAAFDGYAAGNLIASSNLQNPQGGIQKEGPIRKTLNGIGNAASATLDAANTAVDKVDSYIAGK